MKTETRVVVIGGGVVGASVLYHLTKVGWTDVMLLERRELTAGSTWHAAGGMHTLNGDPNVARLQQYTIQLYEEIERFIDLRDIDETLPLHPFRPDRPYYIGVCLMGAYQDVLGDLHNLFGEAHEVLVTVDEQGRPHIEDVLPGESCQRVLEYMNYDRSEILDSIDKQLRRAGRALKKDEVRAIYREFEEVFPRYTYLER